MSNPSQDLILRNAILFDSKNNINGEKKDILVHNGKIVDLLSDTQNVKEIDASNCIAFPGFIDVRTHAFAQETLYHNLLSNSYQVRLEHSPLTKLEQTALDHGFTFLCEMDVPLTQSKVVIKNMNLSGYLDHGMIMDIGSNWAFLSDLESDSAISNIADILSMLLNLVKGLGISTNCPFHQMYWKLNQISHSSNIPMVPKSAIQIYNLLIKAAQKNNIITHFVSPYNKEDSSISQMQFLNAIEADSFILATTNQFFNKDYSNFVGFHDQHKNFTCEISPSTPGHVYPLITRDRNLALRASRLSKIPITTVDLEFDTEYYITGRKIEEGDPYLDSWIQLVWSLKKQSDLRRVFLSSNAPYHMSISDWADRLFDLVQITDHEIGLLDLCALLSANPASILNISGKKGHLGNGADADIICFEADPQQINRNFLKTTKIVIKNGCLLKHNSDYLKSQKHIGKIYWTEGKIDEARMLSVKKRKEIFYDKRFSMHLSMLENRIQPNMEQL